MFRFALACLALTFCLTLPVRAGGDAEPSLAKSVDKIVYAIGLSVAERLGEFELDERELALVQAGLADGLHNDAKVSLRTWGHRVEGLRRKRMELSAVREKEIAANGLTPLEYFPAAPYVHPKLAATCAGLPARPKPPIPSARRRNPDTKPSRRRARRQALRNRRKHSTAKIHAVTARHVRLLLYKQADHLGGQKFLNRQTDSVFAENALVPAIDKQITRTPILFQSAPSHASPTVPTG